MLQLFQVKIVTLRHGEANDLRKLMWPKGKWWRQWLDHNHKFTLVYVCICVCERERVRVCGCNCVLACELECSVFFLWNFFPLFFFLKDNLSFINSAGHVPAREITFSGENRQKGKRKRPCYNVGENCQQVLLTGAYFIQCWCVVLVHMSFQSSLFFLGVGYKGRGWDLFLKDRR